MAVRLEAGCQCSASSARGHSPVAYFATGELKDRTRVSANVEGSVPRLRSGAVVRRWGIPAIRIYYQRHPDELLIVRVHDQARRPISR
jgi:hypothetical protein